MKKFFTLSMVLLLMVMLCAGSAYAKKGNGATKVNGVSRINGSGDITGIVTCKDTAAPAEGFLVYIPGKPFMAITDEEGSFTFFNVPGGTYSLKIVIDPAGVPTDLITGVSISRKQVNVLNLPLVDCPQVEVLAQQ